MMPTTINTTIRPMTIGAQLRSSVFTWTGEKGSAMASQYYSGDRRGGVGGGLPSDSVAGRMTLSVRNFL